MTDSELHEIENHISWGWHDDKGNDDVKLLINEVKRLRTVAAEARGEGIEEMRDAALSRCAINRWRSVGDKFIKTDAERLKEKG